jgi:hypothetical protein
VEMVSGLSPEVDCRLDELISAVVARLTAWGCPCHRLEPAAHA